MSQRLRNSWGTRYEVQGDLLIGAAVPSRSGTRSVTSLVEQDDCLIPTLNVRETLHYAARLRLPTWMPNHQEARSAESVLAQLNLQAWAEILVGGSGINGISKGEKRQVTIGVQLLTDPQILILDSTRLQQHPSSRFFEALLDRIGLSYLQNINHVLISSITLATFFHWSRWSSRLCWRRASDAAYFSDAGYDCPRKPNPADFALDLVTVDLQHAAEGTESIQRVNSLVTRWKTKELAEGNPDSSEGLKLIRALESRRLR